MVPYIARTRQHARPAAVTITCAKIPVRADSMQLASEGVELTMQFIDPCQGMLFAYLPFPKHQGSGVVLGEIQGKRSTPGLEPLPLPPAHVTMQ